mgnify:CR=1 FL=1
MLEPLRINRNTHAPIVEYCQILNYCSENYGTPISPRLRLENEVLTKLEGLYSSVLTDTMFIISEGKVHASPSSNTYNVMHFQRDYMDIPEGVLKEKGKVRRNKEVRRRVDREYPNFINSMYSLWGEYNGRKTIGSVSPWLEPVEGMVNVKGEPLMVIRPRYEIKEDDATFRITTSEPNLQGLSTMYKEEFILPEEGRLLVGADISSQEPNIFFNSLCRDEDILRMYQEVGEIYAPVVAKIENIPVEEVDRELRNSYKEGILSKMNAGGTFLLQTKMGSYELASKLINFIDNNPNYAQFKEKINRQLMTPNPRMGGFIKGWERVLKTKDRGFNKLANAPLQITAICFFSISFFAFCQKMMEKVGDWETLEEFLVDVRPIYHAHDEIVLSIADENGYPEVARECLKWALEVHFEDWVPFKAEPYVSDIYIH